MGNFFRSLFGPKKSNSKIKPRMQSRRLELIGLEERITPAAITNSAGVITVTLADGENLTAVHSNVASALVNISLTSTVAVSITTPITGVSLTTTTPNNPSTIVIDTSLFPAFAGISFVNSATSANAITVDSTGIDLSSAPGSANQSVTVDLSAGTVVTTKAEAITINGAIKSKGTGAILISTGSANATNLVTIAAAGDITTTTGAVAITGTTISTAGNVDTTSGAITYTGVVTLSGNVVTTSTLAGGNLSITGALTLGVNNFTANQGLGNVTTISGGITGSGVVSLTGAAVTTVGAINTTGILTAVATTGDLTFSAAVSANTVTATSIAGNIIFASTVASTAGSVTVSAATAGKSISIVGAVTAALNSDILLTGDVLSNHATTTSLNTTGNGIITITGNVDASVANNNLTLSAATGAITIGGNVGSSSTAMGDLISTGTGLFLASGNVTAHCVNVSGFTTSITFSGDVKTDGVNGVNASTSGAGTLTFSESITSTNATGVIDLQTVNGNLTVIGAINTKKQVEIDSAAGVVVLSGNITNDGTTIPGAQAGVFISVGSGSLTTSGTITAVGDVSGGGGIQIQSYLSNSSVTINGALSTTGGGAIRLQAGNGSGINQMSVNAPVTTSGATAGEIIVYANGGSVTLNQPVTLGTGGKIILSTGLSTDTITINSGAAISAGTDIYDTDSLRGYLSAGKINLAANLTTTQGKINLEPVGGITLSGPVSMKAQGTTVGDIILGSINGAQNLTLEATDQIHFKNSVGQAVALNTLTVTNSRLVLFDGDLTAANVILTNTATTIFFKGNTNITSSLTTTANAYDLYFDIGKSLVIASAPVFLNTGYLSLFGTTSFPSGATITGGSLANVNFAGTIVSGGAFNIGAGLSNINISDNTQLILNSTTAASTFASPINLNAGGAGSFNLLGVGTLTLSANSTAGVTTGDTINVINGTLNVTGKIGGTTFATNGKITGAGGTIDHLTVNTGTVAPGGTLNTGAVTLNAATNYSAAVLSTTTASNLKTASAINLGGATLSLSSVASGLAVNNTFTIIDNTATASVPIVGTFVNQPEGSSISALDASGNTVVFTISYIGGTNTNDVTLTVTNVIVPINLPIQPMVVGQPVLNKFTLTGTDAGGGPLVTVTFSDGTYTTFFAYASTFTGGVRVAAADVNGDGILDIVTGAGPGGGPQVNVFSFNSTGEVVLRQSFFAFDDPSFTGGVYVAAGDTNNDHFDDVVIGAGAGGGPRVQVYGGSADGVVTSAPLNDFFAYASSFTGGVVVAAGDRTGDSFGNQEVITGPASNGGFNVKSFDVNGKGNNPTLVDNFFAFNDTTSIGGLSLASSPFSGGAVQDILIGSTNTQFGAVIGQTGASAPVTITANPFPGFTGAIRVGVAIDSSDTRYAIAAAGPGGGPVISLFSVGSNSMTQTDSLFVLNPAFTGGLFASS